jgi:hypothetical protein
MAYDAKNRWVLLYGGNDPFVGLQADTWAWDGHGWRRLQPPANPGARFRHVMCADLGRQRVVMFGGNAGDTWEWDGSTWAQRSTTGPPPRTANDMTLFAYDQARRAPASSSVASAVVR